MTHIPNIKTKDELPVIALKGVVLFPHLIIPLLFKRPKSMLALEEALKTDRMAVFVAQKNDDNEIDLNNVYNVGTVGRINNMVKLLDGSARIEVEGLKKAKIEKYTSTSPYLKARIKIAESKIVRDVETEALIRHLIDQFKKLSSSSKVMYPDLMAALPTIKDPEQLIELLIFNIDLGIEERQDILETEDIKEALKKISFYLDREMEIVKTEEKVAEETKKQLGKMQKEVFLREQMKSIEKELGVEGEKGEIDVLRRKIKAAGMPKDVEAKAVKELERLEKMPSFSPEVSYLRTYLDWLVELPWSKSTKSKLDIKEAAKVLDEDHFGLEKTKERILEYLAVQKQVGKIKGPILCFVGPPGTGKTSIGKSIARALGRKFHRISLGGVRDEAEIRGHRRTYVGALPGRIIQGVHSTGFRNPVFMLDEIDKIGLDFRGDPSAALLEALDPEQNFAFSDHYLEVPFDLSDVMFITTANVLDTIPPALRDRLEIIEFPGYTEEEKTRIAHDFLIPKLKKEHGIVNGVQFKDDAIAEVIQKYTREAGVRNLEREFAKILRKVVRSLVEKESGRRGKSVKGGFASGGKGNSIEIAKNSVKDYLGPARFSVQLAEEQDEVGIATGLAWTPVGGEVISIEAIRMPGRGRLHLTGKLGKVMQESAMAALSYTRSYLKDQKDTKDFYKYDIHLHVPSGAISKDGPSAGIAMATALVSLFSKRKIHKEVGMTGEVTLRGKVLEIGGIKEKVLAARRAGLKKVIIPKDNEKDLEDIPKDVKRDLKFMFVDKMEEVLKIALR